MKTLRNARLKDEADQKAPEIYRQRRIIAGGPGQVNLVIDDAMNIAVARIYETTMITADKKLVEALARTDFKKHVQWLGDGIS